MVRIAIDNVQTEVPAGATLLDAARQLDIDLPAMCAQDGHPANNACMCCLVRVEGRGVVPACSTKVSEGMQIQSETSEMHALRRTGIELLLADHAGDCHAPCQNTCPAKMDIPNMLRMVADGDYTAALATIKRDIALPAILGRVCPEVCENACRRGQHDSPAAICKIKQFVADRDRKSPEPYRPSVAAATGKQVAVIGAGPTGLTAVYHLSQLGHRCTLVDAGPKLGGRLIDEFAELLPGDVLEAEAGGVLAVAATETRLATQVGTPDALDAMADEFDAVLIATGRNEQAWLTEAGIELTKSGIRVDAVTRMTSRAGVFAAGNAVRPYKLVVQSVAEGKLAAQCIDSFLRGTPPPDRRHAYESRLARLTSQELCDFCEGVVPAPRIDTRLLENLSDDAARHEAQRCLECDCRALANCLLHHYAAMYDCDAARYRGEGRHYEGKIVGERVTLEQGKCILCGICVQLADRADDAVGIAVLGRSTATRIAPPPGYTLDEALGSAAEDAAAACPTGAITLHVGG